ncbi:MAG: gamma-glutamyltransferase [Oscillatoria princeps RMCB-10]|jgi:gamma-glutamyltranspeptidase/glutathione hydrolase|nr:gamma-glutamyltransferase [Oscillatoria princeps RMCB-10]
MTAAIIDFQMPVLQAADSPRVQWENNRFHVEPGLDEEEVKSAELPANTQLVLWKEKNMFFGGFHTLMAAESGLIEGAGDWRRSGAVGEF